VSFTNNKTPEFILPNNMSSLSTESKLLSIYNNDTFTKNKTNSKTYYNYYDYRTNEYPNKYHQHSDGYYTGRVRFKSSNGKITQITMEHTTKDYLGNIQVGVKEKPAKIASEQDAKDYFCYSNFGTGTWQSSIGYVIQFDKDNTINAYDAGAGNPWFLKSGDSVDAVATYSFDTSNNMIIIHDYDRDIKIKYDVINSERVYITVNGYTQEFTTGHVAVSEYGIAKVPENISIKKGSSKTLVPVLPAGVTYKVSYKTSNKNISTISSNGKIIGKKRGSCTITTYVKIGTITTDYKTLVKVN
jgi:hypothetical protein